MNDSGFWDVYSRTYDSVRNVIPYQELLDELVEALDLRPEVSVLDLGCGTGNLEERLGRTTPDVCVTGMDGSEGMLRRAVGKCARYRNVDFVLGDLSEPLPFADASFDCVVANNVLYAVPGRAALMAEAARVLRPGGRFVLSDPKAGAKMTLLLRAHFAAIAAMPPLRRAAMFAKSCVMLPLMWLAPILLITTKVAAERDAGEYRFSTRRELAELLEGFAEASLADAYAGQNWLAVAQAPLESSRTANSAMSSERSLPVKDMTSL